MKVFIRYTSLLATITVDMQPIQSGLAATTILKGGNNELTQTSVFAFLSRVFLDPHNGCGGVGHRRLR